MKTFIKNEIKKFIEDKWFHKSIILPVLILFITIIIVFGYTINIENIFINVALSGSVFGVGIGLTLKSINSAKEVI